MGRLRVPSLRVRLLGATLGLVAAFTIAGSLYGLAQEKQRQLQEIDAQGETLARTVALSSAVPLREHRVDLLQDLARGLVEGRRCIGGVRFLDAQGHLLAQSGPTMVPHEACRRHEADIPVVPGAPPAGHVVLEVPMQRFDALMSARARAVVLTCLGSFLLLAPLLSFLFMRILEEPLHRLLQRACALAQGDLEQPIQLATGDELETLARSLEEMRSNLHADGVRRSAAESALRDSETMYRGFFNRAADSILIYDRQSLGILDCNESMLRQYGGSQEEMRRMTALDLHPPEDRERVRAHLDRRHVDEPFTCTHVNKSGRRRSVEILCDEIEYVGGPAWISVIRDITERKRAEDALRRSEARAGALLHAIPDMMFRMDRNGVCLDFNAREEDLPDCSPVDFLGRSARDVLPPEPAEACMQAIERTLQSGETQVLEYELAFGAGSRGFESRIVKSGEDEVLAIVRDITERRNSQVELQRAKEKAETAARLESEFLAGMSRELRAPMSAVIGRIGQLLDTPLAGEQREQVEKIRNSGEALLYLIDDILDLSKMESGELELEEQVFDLPGCVETCLDLAACEAGAKGLELGYELGPRTPLRWVGDAARLRRVLVNLLSNAVQSTHAGEVGVTIGCSPGAGERELYFAVRDTGNGIPPAATQRALESSGPLDAASIRHLGHTGFGLAVSKQLVQRMGGRIWVENQVGRGSTFHFTIAAQPAPRANEVPLAPSGGATPAASDAAPPPSDAANPSQPACAAEATDAWRSVPSLRGKRVLFVDDHPAARRILVHCAESWGMHARAAASAAEALDWVRKGRAFDIAVLDAALPDQDGLHLAVELRRHPQGESLPLLILTPPGERRLDRPADLPDPGLRGVLGKPIKPRSLRAAFLEILCGGEEAWHHDSSAASRCGRPASPLRILVAEDNAVNQRVVLRILDRLGYGADKAANGVEALEALERQMYDIVLMDVMMPEMDGLEATRRIRERWPGASGPRIVATTASAMPGARERCLAAGMDDYISKPVRLENLHAALERSRDPAAAAETAATEVPSFDPAALGALRELQADDGSDLVSELVDMFVTDAPGRIAELHAALAPADAAGLSRAAHTLKGSAATLGARRLAGLCAALEKQARGGSTEGAAAAVSEIEKEFESVREVLLQQA